jgi:hypothetical protein
MILTKEELLHKLYITTKRDFWFVRDIADAFGLTTRAIQYCATRKGIGKRVKSGKYGTYVFQENDLDNFLIHLHGEVGNPKFRKLSKEHRA